MSADAVDASVWVAAQDPDDPFIAWDCEHLQRAGALSPDDWLIANP